MRLLAAALAALSLASVKPTSGPAQCTLDAREIAVALAEFHAFATAHELASVTVSFKTDPETRGESEAELRRMLAREATCCSHMTFESMSLEDELAVTFSGPADEVRALATVVFGPR